MRGGGTRDQDGSSDAGASGQVLELSDKLYVGFAGRVFSMNPRFMARVGGRKNFSDVFGGLKQGGRPECPEPHWDTLSLRFP